MLALMLATNIVLFYMLYFLAGLFLGIIFLNANLGMLEGKVKNKDSIVNLGHGFFAIGALASPFITSLLLKNQVSWKMIYVVIICLILVAFASQLFIIRKKKIGLLAESKGIDFKKVFKYRKKNIYMILTSVLMFFYVISEVIIFSWAPTFFRIEKLFSLINASLVVSLFWMGILAGRLIISIFSYRIKAGTLLIMLSIISLAGLSCAIFVNSQIINFIGIGLTGIGFSGVPPLLISSAGRIFGSGKEISLTILFLVGITGGSAMPFAITLLSGYGLFFSMLIVIISMTAFFIMVFVRKAYRKTLKANKSGTLH
jgi:FHS family glucose/mannose:H+ symporter-like MFS transporter